MKKILFTLAVVCFSFGFATAQSTTGHIKYKIDMSSDNPEVEMQLAMFSGSTLDISFDGKKSSSTMSMGAMMSIKTITSEDEEVLMLWSGMVGNKAVRTSVEEMKDGEKEKKTDMDVEFVKGSKTVAGYKCKKAISKTEEGDEVVFWYTEKLQMGAPGQGNLNGKIPGIALAFESFNSNMIMSFEAIEVEDTIEDDSIFNMEIPEGYEEMSYDDMKSMGM